MPDFRKRPVPHHAAQTYRHDLNAPQTVAASSLAGTCHTALSPQTNVSNEKEAVTHSPWRSADSMKVDIRP